MAAFTLEPFSLRFFVAAIYPLLGKMLCLYGISCGLEDGTF